MTDTYRELYFDKSDQLLKLMEKASFLVLEVKMYKELYEETNQLLIETRAKLVEITEAIESRPTTRALDVCPECAGLKGRMTDMGFFACGVCNGTGKRQ